MRLTSDHDDTRRVVEALMLDDRGDADSWEGYIATRERVLWSLSKSPSPIVLAGDSHDAWINRLYMGVIEETSGNITYDTSQYSYVAPEFAGNSVRRSFTIQTLRAKLTQAPIDGSMMQVSSPGDEDDLVMPYDFKQRAHESSNYMMESHTTGESASIFSTDPSAFKCPSVIRY